MVILKVITENSGGNLSGISRILLDDFMSVFEHD